MYNIYYYNEYACKLSSYTTCIIIKKRELISMIKSAWPPVNMYHIISYLVRLISLKYNILHCYNSLLIIVEFNKYKYGNILVIS